MPVTNFVWDELGDNVLMEVDDAGSTTAKYTNEPDKFGELISQRRNSADDYFHFDAQQSTRRLTNENQVETDSYTYSAFGETVSSSGTTANPFRYKGALGYYTDLGLDCVYVRTRTYKSELGRWLSTDPLLFNDGNNLYVYVHNHSISAVDPSGTQSRYDHVPLPPTPKRKPYTPPKRTYCGLLSFCCDGKEYRWKVYGDSDAPPLKPGCVTLVNPKRIECTYDCTILKRIPTLQDPNVLILDHEACHACWWERSPVLYVVSIWPDLCTLFPIPRDATPHW